MVARDWLKTLWPSSFKGVPFWSERSQESGGRRVVEHEFPMRDDPFLEDLGEALRKFDITAYLASDAADGEASALAAVCAARGPGLLVLPMQGQVLVRCLEFSRDHEKDRLGYIAFNLKCTREGSAFSIASIAMLANQVFAAADALAAVVALAFTASFSGAASSAADFVTAAASSGLQDAISVIEAVRTSEPVDVEVSARQRDEIQSIFDSITELLAEPDTVGLAPARIVATARALGDGMPPETALRIFESIASDPTFAISVAASYPTRNLRLAAINAAAAARTLRLAALTAYAEAIARVQLSDRPAGITLRANVAEYFEAEVAEIPASEIDLFHTIVSLRDTTIAYISRAILDLAPVITVEANQSMPSLFWAWRLYQDPTRASEIVARNLVQHPSFMPPEFEALAR